MTKDISLFRTARCRQTRATIRMIKIAARRRFASSKKEVFAEIFGLAMYVRDGRLRTLDTRVQVWGHESNDLFAGMPKEKVAPIYRQVSR